MEIRWSQNWAVIFLYTAKTLHFFRRGMSGRQMALRFGGFLHRYRDYRAQLGHFLSSTRQVRVIAKIDLCLCETGFCAR